MATDFAPDLLTRAAQTFGLVDADPSGHRATAAALVTEARHAGRPDALVAALRAQAWAERGRLAHARAKDLLDEAATLARRQGLDHRLGEVLVTRAAVNHELGRSAAAQRDLDAAAPLVGSATTVARDFLQAVLHQNVGRLTPAATVYRGLLANPGTPADVRGKAANNLALIEAQQGRYGSALRYLDHAAAVAAEVGPALRAGVAQSRGWVSVQAGRLPEGMAWFAQAAALYSAAGLPLGEFYIEYSDALADLRLLPEASAAATAAVEEFRTHGVRLLAAEAQLRAARLALLSGDPAAAGRDAATAASGFRAQRRPAWAARADLVAVEAKIAAGRADLADLRRVRRAAATMQRLGIRSGAVHAHLTAGRLAGGLGRAGLAARAFTQADRLARGAPVLVRLDGRVAAARAARLAGDERGLLRECRAGLADLVRHRAALPSMELRALASGHGTELGRLALQVALRAGDPAQVLAWLERTRSAALSSVQPPPTDGVEEELAALRAVQGEMAEQGRGGVESSRLLDRQRDLEDRVRRATWARRGEAGSAQAPVGVAQLRRLLGERVLVEYGVHRGELFAVVVQPRSSRIGWLGPVDAVTADAATLQFALRRLAQPRVPAAVAAARASAESALRRLTETLLTPLRVASDVGLVVAPVGPLYHLPWSALHPAAVSLTPSATLWARTCPDAPVPPGPTRPGATLLVAGPGLPGAVAEVQALREVHDGATVLAPPRSTVAAVAKALAGAELAHLACHGQLRSDNPMFSSLRMSDGPLTLHEMDRRGIAPRRILLAACESAGQVAYAGDEVVGFVSALMARGTAGLVASTINVPDSEAVDLMRALHRRVRAGASLADALHGARAGADRDDPRAFVTWCAFTAYGAA